MTKRKLYWMLMPLFLVIGILIILLLPRQYWYLAFVVSLLFWLIYYSAVNWLRKKTEREEVFKKS